MLKRLVHWLVALALVLHVIGLLVGQVQLPSLAY